MEYEGFVTYETREQNWADQNEGWYWHPTPRETFGPFEDVEDAEAFAVLLSN